MTTTLLLMLIAQPFTGRFEGPGFTLELSQQGDRVTGVLSANGLQGRLRATARGAEASGQLAMEGEQQPVQLRRRGEQLDVVVDGDPQTLRLANAPPAPSPRPAATSPRPGAASRKVSINGVPLTPARLALLERLERASGGALPDGSWWYDARCGAFGAWGGPALAFIPAGLDLGPPVPARASGGGTGVFINGRELHPVDVRGLALIIGPVIPGRYLVDAMGNGFLENGVYLGNLVAAMRQRASASRGGSFNYFSGAGSNSFSVVGDGQFMGACTGQGDCAYLGN
jgi:hypothetical protein